VKYVCGACGQSSDREGYCSTDGQQLVAAQDPLLGTEVGRYRIARQIGAGGMGQVYLGIQPMIGSRVAIKILSPECSRVPELLERFFAEARAVNMIKHESIVSVIDMALLADGRPYIIMEFIEGQTLGEIVRTSAAPIGGVVQVTTEMLSALGAAHALGIVHRDLKPDNVLVTGEGHAKVLDFGIAKLAPGLGNMMSPRTATGALLGTPAYMAPEQISGAQNVDARTDIYAAGVVLFEAVTGRTPFVGETLYDLMKAHLELQPPSPRSLRPDLPLSIERVILTALEKDPARRFQSAAEMTHALHDAARELPPDQWRALSRAALTAGRPSLDHLRHLTPQGTAHAPTVRASVVVAPTQRDRPRGRGTMIAIVAVAAIAVGVVALVISQRGGTKAPAREPEPVAINAPAGAPPPVADPVPVPAPPVQAPVQNPPSAPAAPPRTATPPAPPPVAPPRTGPTIVGGGSAADHGVHIGAGVTMGAGVTIGGSTPSAPAAPVAPPAGQGKNFTLPIDYNPKKFDGAAYAPKALALARRIFSDAKLARYDIANVYPSGLADLGLTDDQTTYWFRSPSRSARPAGVPKNIEVEIECYVEVEVSPRAITVRARDISVDNDCQWKLRELPKCTMADVWARAKDEGAALDTVAKVAFLSDGEWFFDNGDVKSYKDTCR